MTIADNRALASARSPSLVMGSGPGADFSVSTGGSDNGPTMQTALNQLAVAGIAQAVMEWQAGTYLIGTQIDFPQSSAVGNYMQSLILRGQGGGDMQNTVPLGGTQLDCRYNARASLSSVIANATCVLWGLQPTYTPWTGPCLSPTVTVTAGAALIGGVLVQWAGGTYTVGNPGAGTYYLDLDTTGAFHTVAQGGGAWFSGSSIRLAVMVLDGSGNVTWLRDRRCFAAQFQHRYDGSLKIRDISLVDYSASTTNETPFFMINTAYVRMRDMMFSGPYVGTTAVPPLRDAVHLGGTGTSAHPATPELGQIYGINREADWNLDYICSNIRRAVRYGPNVNTGRGYFMLEQTCGGDHYAPAIDVFGTEWIPEYGLHIEGGDLEVSRYTYICSFDHKAHSNSVGPACKFSDAPYALAAANYAGGNAVNTITVGAIQQASNVDPISQWANRVLCLNAQAPDIAELVYCTGVVGTNPSTLTLAAPPGVNKAADGVTAWAGIQNALVSGSSYVTATVACVRTPVAPINLGQNGNNTAILTHYPTPQMLGLFEQMDIGGVPTSVHRWHQSRQGAIIDSFGASRFPTGIEALMLSRGSGVTVTPAAASQTVPGGPTVAAGAGAGVGATINNLSGTDVSLEFDLATAGAPAAGTVAVVTFAQSIAPPPRHVLVLIRAQTGHQFQVTALGNTGFNIVDNAALGIGTFHVSVLVIN